ncbi:MULTISPECIES: NADPH dehydrogenase NamA [Clostridium]|uniref:NADH-flavin oxidoreductase/NADH oxidase NADH n=1 Tax=Clostridium saccharoperbutylacetonicum N1-4(HMT) TaxID=931276 RepID=M1LSR1_9CLOT|nr:MULTISPECIES: NADPH dehydrogenase NamA [Clostridium]AGF56040.1 NADH-flavin oxidoreductase/NADH oxidase NADH [Clostridium saccharoperbutylacetonicum N1-4(HMT)]AQR94775.1 NADPH dehydrogenase [Clostridium saccharoperbutylacetonicum]NRT63221.1 NADPH2 dehydrogenase [Clostridium saccharoperbutylacetonicum]NSB26581.1 NADPH2 dehydrogenase [Clostridium saccharoperbutylacetonicum]NSB30616.1 NADPH2 dehydrogenase [Clostridium saccharoperbutylacetonicum]
MKTFENYKLKNMNLKNRIVMPPMCMYSSDETGIANDFHYTHYVTRAIGAVGLIIVESTGVSENGRTTDRDLGIWDDKHIDKLKKIVDGVNNYGSKIAIQLNHAGRKYTGTASQAVAPSAIKFDEKSTVPKELTKDYIKEIVLNFKEAAKRADKAGFDAIEIHGAHGYLIHQFLSPLSNLREDEYGGDIKNRTRFLKEILEAVREVWPKEKTIMLRVSAYDYKEGGITINDMVEIINEIKEYIDIVHVSTGGLIPVEISAYPGYQVNFASTIKEKCNIPTIAVGLITDVNMAEEIISNGRADLVAIGRELLRNPYFVLNEAKDRNLDINYPEQYKAALK